MSRSLALHSKDLVVTATQAGYLATLTLDLDNSETSTGLHYITPVNNIAAVESLLETKSTN